MKKKIINTAIAFVLIVVSVVLFGYRGSMPIAHEDIYANKSINSMNELYDVTGFIVDGLEGGAAQSDGTYHSATLHITLSEKISVDVEVTGSYKAAETIEIEQDLTCYLAGNGIFIESQAVVFSKAKNGFDYSSIPSKGYAKYNVNIYLTEDKVYIKFLEYDSASNLNSTIIKPDYINQWIETTEEAAMGFLPLVYESEMAVGSIFNVLKTLLESGDIGSSDVLVSFDEDSLLNVDPLEFGDVELSGLNLNRDKYKEDFKIDISDPMRPYIAMGARYKDKIHTSVRENYYGWLVTQDTQINIVAAMEVTISNINNTVIDWSEGNNSVYFYAQTPDDFERFFVIKVYKEVDNE